MNKYLKMLLFTIFTVPITTQVYAVDKCGLLPDYIREFNRNMQVCVKDSTKCGEGDYKIETQVFNNDPTVLPRAPSGSYYLEGKYKVKEDRDLKNKFRLVYLLDKSENINKKYYSSDHYETFCELN